MSKKQLSERDICTKFITPALEAAGYLTFVAATGTGGVEAVYADESIWLTQKMMATLYDIDVRTINYHLKKIFGDSELQEDSVIRNFRITAADGKNYNTKHYKLPAIIAVGYKVNSERAVQFRKWATGIIHEYTIKTYVMDDERIKSGGSNAPSESWFGSFKNERVYGERFETRDEMMAMAFEYIEMFYNRKRLHSTLRYKSPMQLLSDWLTAGQEEKLVA